MREGVEQPTAVRPQRRTLGVAIKRGGLEGVEKVELGVEGVGQDFGDMRGLRSWKGGGRKLSKMPLPDVGCGEVFRG